MRTSTPSARWCLPRRCRHPPKRSIPSLSRQEVVCLPVCKMLIECYVLAIRAIRTVGLQGSLLLYFPCSPYVPLLRLYFMFE